jgi:hypothetical protein
MNNWSLKFKIKVSGQNPDDGSKYNFDLKIKIPISGKTLFDINQKINLIIKDMRKAAQNGNVKYFQKFVKEQTIDPSEGIEFYDFKLQNRRFFKLPKIPPLISK